MITRARQHMEEKGWTHTLLHLLVLGPVVAFYVIGSVATAQEGGAFVITDLGPNPIVEGKPATVLVRTIAVPMNQTLTASAVLEGNQQVVVALERITKRLLVVQLSGSITAQVEGIRVIKANGVTTPVEPIDRVTPTTGEQLTQAWVDDLEALTRTYLLEARLVRETMYGALAGLSEEEAEEVAESHKEELATVRDISAGILDELEERFEELLKEAAIPGSEANQRINDGKALTHFREKLFDASAEAMAALIDERVPVTTRSAIDLHYLHPPTVEWDFVAGGFIRVRIRHDCDESRWHSIRARIERIDSATGAVVEIISGGAWFGHGDGTEDELVIEFPIPPAQAGTEVRIHWETQCGMDPPSFGNTPIWIL